MAGRAFCFLGAFGVTSCLILPVGVNSAQAAKSRSASVEKKSEALPDAQSSREAHRKTEARVTKQLIVVLAESWNTHRGELRQFDSTADGPWQQVGDPTPVSLGRYGMAWGRGLLEPTDRQRSKKEGDGRSPAGIFELGTAFGVADTLPASSRNYPYLPVTERSYCVEDTGSANYNRLIDLNESDSQVWQKRSPLLRSDGLFQWGVVVEQNTSPVTVGAGSCIFLHVWRGAHIGTAGCTAMPLEAAAGLVSWLAPKTNARLVQLPRSVYDEVRLKHGLPEVAGTKQNVHGAKH